jgi:hypothetical protein
MKKVYGKVIGRHTRFLMAVGLAFLGFLLFSVFATLICPFGFDERGHSRQIDTSDWFQSSIGFSLIGAVSVGLFLKWITSKTRD